MYKIALDTEEKTYYLVNREEPAVRNLFGHSYIWGTKDVRKFKTKAEANKVLKDLKRYGTGKNAYIKEIKKWQQKN